MSDFFAFRKMTKMQLVMICEKVRDDYQAYKDGDIPWTHLFTRLEKLLGETGPCPPNATGGIPHMITPIESPSVEEMDTDGKGQEPGVFICDCPECGLQMKAGMVKCPACKTEFEVDRSGKPMKEVDHMCESCDKKRVLADIIPEIEEMNAWWGDKDEVFIHLNNILAIVKNLGGDQQQEEPEDEQFRNIDPDTGDPFIGDTEERAEGDDANG